MEEIFVSILNSSLPQVHGNPLLSMSEYSWLGILSKVAILSVLWEGFIHHSLNKGTHSVLLREVLTLIYMYIAKKNDAVYPIYIL